MVINKFKLQKIIEPFYPGNFRIFYINSLGENKNEACPPMGVFISLGLNTTIHTISGIKNLLEKSSKYSSVELVKIKSISYNGLYLNSILERGPDIKQFQTPKDEFPENLFDKESSRDELNNLKEGLTTDTSIELFQQLIPKIGRLQSLIHKLDQTTWEDFFIQKTQDGDYKVFNARKNYIKNNDGSECRFGIYVSE